VDADAVAEIEGLLAALLTVSFPVSILTPDQRL